MTIAGIRRRLGHLEQPNGPMTGLAEALEEARRRARAGLPRRPPPSAEELSLMTPSLRGAWQRIIQAHQRVADYVPATC